MKRTPLIRKTGLKRTPFKPQPPRQHRTPPKPSRSGINFTEKIKAKARLRAGDRCEVGAPGCSGQINQYHHRRMRSQGGVGSLVNCLACCSSCHTRIHQRVEWAYRHGLLVKSWLEPHEVPVVTGCEYPCDEEHRRQ